jgi:CTP:molybdopterin cytidylyltransferase MocA/HD superfamily phosphodiesterase
MAEKLAAVILAAGYSSRMGELKPLLDVGGVTALERAVTLFRTAGIRDVRVVTGHRAAELAPHLKRLQVREVPNPRYDDGMFASVVAGVASIGEEVDAFFVLPVDLPLVRPATVSRLLEAYRQGRHGIVYPSFTGKRGHPPLIVGWLAPEIVRWNGSGGLMGLLVRWEGVAHEVEVADEQILRDMDTPDDYRKVRERAEHLHVPTSAECRVLLDEMLKVEPQIVRHGQKVAEVAVQLAEELNRAGGSLDVPLLAAAGLLHDLARNQPDHAKAGARLLRESGYEAVADLVDSHMDIVLAGEETVTAAEVLYLADKLFQGERRVSLAERFSAALERHAHEPAVVGKITGRLKNAKQIQRRLEMVTGLSLEEVVKTA